MTSLSRVRLFATPWTAAYQAPLSMGFSRQEYWSGVPLPSPNLNLIMRGKKKTPSKLKLKDSRENNWPVLIKKCHWHERLDRTKLSQVRGDWGGVKIKCYVVSRTSGGSVTKSCLTRVTHGLSPPGSSVHRIFQARILEWVALSFSKGSSWPRASCTSGTFFTDWATREAHSKD